MGIITRAQQAWRVLTNRALTREYFDSLGITAPTSTAGVRVDSATALTLSAFWNGVNVIGGDIGVLDRIPYERGGDDERSRLPRTHYLYKLMAQPNPYMTAQTFWQTLMGHVLTYGNAYAEIEFDMATRPIALWPILPNQIRPRTNVSINASGRAISDFWYDYNGPTGTSRLEPEDVIHIPGLGFDGIRGYSVIAMARESLGLGLAAERFGAAFFGNGTWPGLALQHPGTLTDDAHKRLKESMESLHRGADRSHRLIILEENMKVSKPLTITPDEAQFIGTHAMNIEDIARWLNMPPHKLKHKMGERPGGNLEASQIEYLQGTLLPWTTRIEQELNRKLIAPSQQSKYYIEHLYEKLLRADIGARVTAEQAWFGMGVVSAEQIAKLENLPKPQQTAKEMTVADKIESVGQLIRAGFDPASSLKAVGLPQIEHTGLVPVTVKDDDPPSPAPVTEAGPAPAKEAPPVDDTSARSELLAYCLGQYVRRESGRVLQAAKKDPGAFEEWCEDFYRREPEVLRDAVAPFVRFALAAGGCKGDETGIAGRIAAAYLEESREALLSLKAKDLAFQVERLTQRWEETRPAALAAAILKETTNVT